MKKQLNPTIKAHLTRGALYLLLLVTLCAIPFALAQRNTTKRAIVKAKLAPATTLAATGTRSGAAASLSGVTQHRRAVMPRSQAEAPNDAVPFFAGAPGGCQFHVLIAYSDEGPPTQLQSEILAEPNIVAVDLFDAQAGTPTLAQLQ